MKKAHIAAILAVISVLAIGGVVTLNNRKETPEAKTGMNNHNQTSSSPTGPVSDTPMNTAPASANSVEIKNYAFQPSKIAVKKGTTVTWTNQDSDKHDVTPDDESTGFKASKLLGKGESYSFTFNTVGSYSYYCSPHPYMKGTVEVTE